MLRYLFAAALLATGSAAQEVPQAFIGAQVLPITAPPLANGIVVIHEGKIVAVGEASAIEVPANASRHDLTGKVVMPGLVDTHSHAGDVEGGDASAAMHPEVRVLDSINVRDPRIQKAQAGGITTSNIMSGSGHLLSGQTLYVKHRDAKAIDELYIYRDDGSLAYGVKMANGTNSRKDPPFPGTRAKSAALIRERFLQAVEFRDKLAQASGDPTKVPSRDLGSETLIEVLEGKRAVHFHTHRHDDIVTILRLAREFEFKVVLQHVSDGWLVADRIAASPHVLGASLILIDSPGGKLEAKDNRFETAGVLDRAGVLTGFHTDDPITDSRLFLRMAALGVRAGMTRERALYGLTMAGAVMLEMEDRIGSLDVGKDADLVVLSGDPLSVYSQVLETWVDGQKVFDRTDPQDQLYAEGGYGAGQERLGESALRSIVEGEYQ